MVTTRAQVRLEKTRVRLFNAVFKELHMRMHNALAPKTIRFRIRSNWTAPMRAILADRAAMLTMGAFDVIDITEVHVVEERTVPGDMLNQFVDVRCTLHPIMPLVALGVQDDGTDNEDDNERG